MTEERFNEWAARFRRLSGIDSSDEMGVPHFFLHEGRELFAELAAAREEIAGLRAAMEPFAKYAAVYGGDFRRAAEALAAQPESAQDRTDARREALEGLARFIVPDRMEDLGDRCEVGETVMADRDDCYNLAALRRKVDEASATNQEEAPRG